MTIGELAEAAGVSRRTVRYYVQRGLLPAPDGLGRGARYGEEHLRRLIEVRDLQAQGVSLAAIGTHPTASLPPVMPARPAPPKAERWLRVVVAPGIEVHIEERHLKSTSISAISEAVAATIQPSHKPKEPS